MSDISKAIDQLLDLAGLEENKSSKNSSPAPKHKRSISYHDRKGHVIPNKKSCIPEFHFLNNSQSQTPLEISFQAQSSSPETSLEVLEILKDVSDRHDKILEKASTLLDLQTSKTTRLSDTYRDSVNDREKSSKSSFFKQSPTKTRTLETVKRLYREQAKTKEKIEDLRLEQKEKEERELRFHPKILEKSRTMLIGRRKPLFQRTEEIMKQRKEEMERLKRMRAQEKEEVEKELTFHPEIMKKGKGKRDIYREFDEWRKRKEEKIERLNVEIIKKEVESLTFKPEVNTLSKKLVERKKRKVLAEKTMEMNNETTEKIEKKSIKNASFSKGKSPAKAKQGTPKEKKGQKTKDKENLEGKKTEDSAKKESEKSRIPAKTNIPSQDYVTLGRADQSVESKKEWSSSRQSKQSTPQKNPSRSAESKPSSAKKSSGRKERELDGGAKIERTVNVVHYEPGMDFLMTLLKK